MKVLIIAPRFPFPLEKGDKLRLYHQIRNLHGSVDLRLIALSDVRLEQSHYDELLKYVKKIYVFPINKWGVFSEGIGRIFSGMPFQVQYFYRKNIHKTIRSIIKDENPDVVYCQLARAAEYARDYDGKKVLDYMDAFSFGMGKRIEGSNFLLKRFYKLEQKRMEHYEKDIFKDFNAHTIISEQDKLRIFREKNNLIQVVPNGVDTEYFAPQHIEKKYDICFVGNMGYRPNVDAADFLCTRIVPQLVKIKPELKVIIAGVRPHPRIKALQNRSITVSGWMEDIREAYASSAVFVAPIFTGIGQQNKVLEAMSMEMPCVCTTSVNLPIGSLHGEEVLVADDISDFIRHINLLLDNPGEACRLGKNARILVQKEYSWTKQVELLKLIFNTL